MQARNGSTLALNLDTGWVEWSALGGRRFNPGRVSRYPFTADRMEDKTEVLAFTSNVDTAFEMINQENSHVLYKSVLIRISFEPRVAIIHRV
jgi:hypothetical protein